MIISRGRAYVFVHIPKTGGTAMALALEARAMRDDMLIGDTPKARARCGRLKGLTPRGRMWKHSMLADIEGVLRVEDMSRMFVFTLVRNPWDRLVSYYHWLRVQVFDHPAVARAKALHFSAFLAHPATQRSIRDNTYGSYLRDVDGVDRARLFIRLEHLEADMAPLAAHLGFVPDIPRVNVSDRQRDWRGYYSDADAALVGRICAEDIARFGYGFDPVG